MMARPLLRALAALKPAITLRAAGPPGLIELLSGDGGIDELEAWPDRGAARAELMRRVRGWKPDAALILPPSFSSALAARRSGAPRRIGFASEGRSPLLTDAWRRPSRGDLHLAAEYLALRLPLSRAHPAFAALAAPDRGDALALPALEVEGAARDAARALRSSLAPESAPLALLAPGARYGPAKRWSADRYVELGRRLISRGFALAVCGTREEAAICDQVAAGANVRSLAGQTPLATLAAL